MRKYENVDIVAVLGSIMEINTEHYKSDFEHDKEMIMNAAVSPDGENNHLLWLSRKSGTECFKERDVLIEESYANHALKYHAGTEDTILAYAVNITTMENGKAIGNLYELDYQEYVREVKKMSSPLRR